MHTYTSTTARWLATVAFATLGILTLVPPSAQAWTFPYTWVAFNDSAQINDEERQGLVISWGLYDAGGMTFNNNGTAMDLAVTAYCEGVAFTPWEYNCDTTTYAENVASICPGEAIGAWGSIQSSTLSCSE